jgi:hypothetical protein
MRVSSFLIIRIAHERDIRRPRQRHAGTCGALEALNGDAGRIIFRLLEYQLVRHPFKVEKRGRHPRRRPFL